MITMSMKSPYTINEALFVIHDGANSTVVMPEPREVARLEHYYNDVYKLLLAKLVNFDRVISVKPNESEQLIALVRELITVKTLLVSEK